MSSTQPKTFEERVLDEFETLVQYEKIGYAKKVTPSEMHGFMYLFYLVLKLIRPLEEKAMRDLEKRDRYKEYDNLSDQVLSELEVKKSIRDYLANNGSRFVLTPERYCLLITKALNRLEFIRMFDFEIDSNLLGWVAYKVHNMGLQEFCAEVEYETR